jgi:hypothetical protein
MTSEDIRKMLEAVEEIDRLRIGQEIAIEAERAVVAALVPYQLLSEDTPTEVLRRVRQRLDSESLIRQWQREVDAYNIALAALRAKLEGE